MSSWGTGLIALAMVVGGLGVSALAFSLAAARSRAFFVCAWSSVAVWFGALPLVGRLADPSSAFARDALNALVLIPGLLTTLGLIALAMRARRRESISADGVQSRYFWTPWQIFGWTLTLGEVLVFAGGFAVASIVGVVLDGASAGRVELVSQNVSIAIVLGFFVMFPVSATAGVWRWQRLRAEEAVRRPAPELAGPSSATG